MKVKQIEFPTPLSESNDIENDSFDVFVELEDGNWYTMVVATPQSFIWYMDKEGDDYIKAGAPDIIVRSLTYDNIYNAIQKSAEGDAYWLKIYHLCPSFNIEELNNKMEQLKNKNNI